MDLGNEIFITAGPYIIMHSIIDAFDSLCYACNRTRHPGQIPEGKPAMATGMSDHPPVGWFLFIASK